MGSQRVGHAWAKKKKRKNALEQEMATHSSVLAWRIPGTEEPGGLRSVGSHRVRDRERSGETKTETLPLYLVMRRSVITFSRPV